jgi:hypothetical protein
MNNVLVKRKKKSKIINLVMDPKGRPDTQTNWSTDCRPQDDLGTRNFSRPDLSSERAPHRVKTVTLKKKKNISGQKSQIGLDTETC